MAIVVVTEDGAIHALPEALALDDHDIGVETPGVDIPRRHGSMRFDRHKAVQPRKLTASGHIHGIGKADAERIGAELRSTLAGAGVLKLKRTADSDYYVYCEARDIRSDYNRGHFGASMLTLSVTFEAIDPWWYTDWQGVLKLVSGFGEQWTVSHPGSGQNQPVIVHVVPTTAAITNTYLTCLESGSTLHCTSAIGLEQVLTADSVKRTAVIRDYNNILLGGAEAPIETNVWAGMNTGWQSQGFTLVPGDNTITWMGSGAAKIYVEFTPRSW